MRRERRSRRVSVPPEWSVVVADDDDDVRGVVAAVFRALGINVLEAQNGKAALDLALDPRVGLVVTDFRMPVMDGNQLIEEVLKARPDMKIVCITASSWHPSREDIPILRKPFRVQELMDLGLKSLEAHAQSW